MAEVNRVQKKPDAIQGSLGAIGSVVGSIYGGPAGGAAGGAIGGSLAGDANKPGAQPVSAPEKRMAIHKLQRGLNAAQSTGDAESASTIQQALERADNKNQSKITDDTIARRLARQQGGV